MRSIGLPLLHAEEVAGVVSSMFVDIRARMAFVPALFKALAADPEWRRGLVAGAHDL